MGSFGEKLRREREKRGIRLEEIAEATKISTRSLKALEDENFSQLPGGIFNKGFVRAYAKHLGIDEEEAVADYVATAGDQQGPSAEVVAQQKLMAKASRLAAEQASQSGRPFPLVKVLAVVVAAGILVFAAVRLLRGEKVEPPPSNSLANNQVAAPLPPPVTSSPTPQPEESAPQNVAAPELASTAAQPAQGFAVSIRSTEACWVSIQADGKQELMGTLAPNEQRTFSAQEKIDMVIGHPSTTELVLNGKPLPIPGDLTRTRRIIVGADGIREQ